MGGTEDSAIAGREAHAFHLLAKPTGSRCDLACAYCFFRAKAALYPGQRQEMSHETLEVYLRQLFDAHPPGPVTVAWQGGEPTLMGLDFFRRSVELAEHVRRDDQQAEHTIQTNAVRLDDEWATFLAQHDYLVGVSIDGPEDVHDAYRRDRAGAPTHERVMEAIARLEAHGVRWNALATVHHANEGLGAAVYRHLRDEAGARFIQFIPIVERPTSNGVPFGSAVTERSVSAAGYGTFMVDVFEEWIRRDVGTVFVQTFDAALATWSGLPSPLCVHAETCGDALAMEFNGDVYPCDHFVEPERILGNVHDTPLESLAAGDTQLAFGHEKANGLAHACRACRWRHACNGGCPKDRFVPTGNGPPGSYLCEGYARFFDHADAPLRAMAALLRSGRCASAVMGEYRSQDAKLAAAVARAGRNEPCPCGSGLKTKRCHGRGIGEVG